MALRREERSVYYRSFEDSPWGSKVQLPGSHFHDPNFRALIIIYGICFVATLAISSWRTGAQRKRWGLLIFSIFMSIV